MKRYLVVLVLVIVAIGGGIVLMSKKELPSSEKSPAPRGDYVALGDSVAAGVGLMTDSDTSACDRTDQSYPFLVAKTLHYRLTNLACSGATINQGITDSQTVNELDITPQLETLYTKRPKLITLTIGANDVGWLSLLAKCYRAQCGTSDDKQQFEAQLVTTRDSLKAILSSIRTHYQSTSRLLVVGYYDVFSTSDASCSDTNGLTSDELAWGRDMQGKLNEMLQSTVAETDAGEFMAANFSGHELCTQTSWVQGLTDKAPYHPNAAGQTAIAKQIENLVGKGQ